LFTYVGWAGIRFFFFPFFCDNKIGDKNGIKIVFKAKNNNAIDKLGK